mmetsp:Transcript_22242/g.48867  ORF Transcript_22242/g.48867 Transcript_22242/m.48867 type:complete len:316 (-) Transcript_22242:3-950(-)
MAFTSSTVVSLFTSNTQSVRDPFSSGTRTASPFSLPFRSGKMSATAVADPVEVGARLIRPARARRRSDFLLLQASTNVWVLVTLCTVVMQPCLIPRFSLMTLTTGARQFVVQEAAVTMWFLAGSYSLSLHPTTMFRMPSDLTGAETRIFFTPWLNWGEIFSVVRNSPVHSSTSSTPYFSQGMSPHSLCMEYVTFLPSITMASAVVSILCGQRPCTLSNSSRYAEDSKAPGVSLMCTSSISGHVSHAIRNESLPILPNPLTPTLIGAIFFGDTAVLAELETTGLDGLADGTLTGLPGLLFLFPIKFNETTLGARRQ